MFGAYIVLDYGEADDYTEICGDNFIAVAF
jgi:hypothetical protein